MEAGETKVPEINEVCSLPCSIYLVNLKNWTRQKLMGRYVLVSRQVVCLYKKQSLDYQQRMRYQQDLGGYLKAKGEKY